MEELLPALLSRLQLGILGPVLAASRLLGFQRHGQVPPAVVLCLSFGLTRAVELEVHSVSRIVKDNLCLLQPALELLILE